MWLSILLFVGLVLAIVVGVWGQSRRVYWTWSPAVILLMLVEVLFITDQIGWH
jgi:hypothetical protein